MISTFQRNQHFRKVSVNKTFTHVQVKKKTMKRCGHEIPLHSVWCKNTFMTQIRY